MNHKMKSIELKKSNHKKKYSEITIRIFWNIIYRGTAIYLPRFASPWRVLLLKMFGAKIDRKCLICKGVWIDIPYNLTIGEYSAIGENVWLYNFENINIGDNSVISQNSVICTATHDFSSSSMTLTSSPIVIKSQVWIASDTFILPGVTIGEGAVIGARSVVTKDMPAWMVCAGHPCKPIKTRIITD